jgi:hypothetical protein
MVCALNLAVWVKGATETVSRLIGRVAERPASDPQGRIQAPLIISALLAFGSGQSISLPTMEWSSIGPAELDSRRRDSVQIAALDERT